MAVSSKSTQEFVPIREIRDGIMVLKDGSMRVVLMASSLNFALKSEDEQGALIMQYQNFLNSLDFTMQIFIESRKLDIGPYLGLLEDVEKEQTNELLKIQTREYMEFIRNFVKSTNIVTKNFYTVVPYNPAVTSASSKNPLSDALGIFKKQGEKTKQRDIEFEEIKTQLQQRAGVIQDGLSRIGIRTVPLNTEELIELFYKLFNPEEAESKKLTNQISALGQ